MMDDPEELDDMELRRDAEFPPTSWTVVLAAVDDEGHVADRALSILCGNYWYPLYAYARRLGKPPAEAEDLTQEALLRAWLRPP